MRLGRRIVDALRHPRRLVAFLRRATTLARRGELRATLQRLRPRGFDADDYQRWCKTAMPIEAARTAPPFIVALDAIDSDAAWTRAIAERLGDAAAVLVRSPAGRWRALDGGDEGTIAAWASRHRASWIWWIAVPLELSPDAQRSLAVGCSLPGARIVYTDHEQAAPGGSIVPVFKPAWDAIRVCEDPYPAPVLAIHETLCPALDDSRDTGIVAQWRLLLRLLNEPSPEAIVHVPRVVARIAAARAGEVVGVSARLRMAPDIEGVLGSRDVRADIRLDAVPWLRLRPMHPRPASIVIPTRDRVELLERCLDRVLSAGLSPDAQIVVVDNGSSDPRLPGVFRAYGERADLHVVSVPGAFNFAKLCNEGVAASRGGVIVLLNNDTQVQPGWLDELLGLASRRDVGAAGPLLVYPDGKLQSAGVLLGVNRTATSALAGFRPDDPAAVAWCSARRRVSAIMGACVAVARDKYLAAGGMDERFSVSHNEVDFCLRLEAAGLCNVFTPFARVVHDEGGSRGFEVTREERGRLDAEETAFATRWTAWLQATDPAHHPALARTGNPFTLAPPEAPLRPRAGWRNVRTAP